MPHFCSYEPLIKKIVSLAVSTPTLHARWLNTLSYLENCGARQLASAEHPMHVREEMLKHAQEEFRHAHTLKRQIHHVIGLSLVDYDLPDLLGGYATKFYLKRLEIGVIRYMRRSLPPLTFVESQKLIYLFTTYAIERRAEELYPIYEKALRQAHSRISVRPIIQEEHEHLQHVIRELQETLPAYQQHLPQILQHEQVCTHFWLQSVVHEVDFSDIVRGYVNSKGKL